MGRGPRRMPGNLLLDALRQRIVVVDPVLHFDGTVFGGGIADDDALDTGVDDQAAAHGAGGGVGDQLAVLGVAAGHVQGGAQGVLTGGRNDAVGLGVDAAAQLVALAGGDVQCFAGAVFQIGAVLAATGGAVVAGGNDLVVLDDDGAVDAAQAGGPLQNGLGDIQIVVFLADTINSNSSVRL